MKKDYSKTRCMALLCAFIFIFSLVLTGCGSIKKITKRKTSTSDDEIQVGDGNVILDGQTEIIVGEDGNSYIVDEEGNSVPNTNSVQSGNKYTASQSQIYNSTSPANTITKTTKPTTTKGTTAATTTADAYSGGMTSDVYNALAIQRKFGFNAAYDWGSKFVNFYLSTIRAYFTCEDANGVQKDWLIELWKGEYAMATVGCEVGFYYTDHDSNYLNLDPEKRIYKSVEDADAMQVSMQLYQYKKSSDTSAVQMIDYGKRNCWWAADFETGVLEKHRDQTTLAMIATIDFPNDTMLDLFCEQLDKKGFKEGSISSYKNVERYSVSGRTVKICWKNFSEEKVGTNA